MISSSARTYVHMMRFSTLLAEPASWLDWPPREWRVER
jgi:hypothetical protein